MQIRINRHLPERSTKDNEYIIVKIDIRRIVCNGKYMILVVSNGKGGYVLNAEYKGNGYAAPLPFLDIDDAANAARAFFEAVKAGHDSFEVQA